MSATQIGKVILERLLTLRGIEFGSGHDMNELLGEFDINPTPTEIEQ